MMPDLVALDMLPSCLSPIDLQEMLSVFPGVVRTEVQTDRDGISLGSAVVQTRDSVYRDLVIQALDGLEIFGQSIRAARLEAPDYAAA